jgi:hypothetical protein
MSARAGGPGARRLTQSTAVAAAGACALGGLLLLSAALIGGKVLSPGDQILFAPPFSSLRPLWLTRPSNIGLADLTYLIEPHLSFSRAAIRSGQLPLWNPALGAGRPLGAQQGGPLFPTSWLAYVLPFWSSLGWIAWCKLVIAGTGMALLARAQGLGRPAAVLAAVMFAFSTVFVAFLGHGHTNVFALAPWMLIAVDRIAGHGRLGDAALLALLLGAASFSGHPESFALGALLAYAYLAWLLIAGRRARTLTGLEVRRRAALAGAAGALACAIGALMLLPFFELLGQSFRISRAGGGLPDSLRELGVGLAFPELWGRADKVIFQTGAHSASALFPVRPYLGALAPLLIAAGLTRRPGSRQGFFVTVAIATLLALLDTPLHAALGHVPGVSLINLVELMWPLTLALAMLAAFGLDLVLRAEPPARRRALWVMASIAGAAAILALVTRTQALAELDEGLGQLVALTRTEKSPDVARIASITRWVLIASLAGALAWWLTRRGRPRALGAVLVAITAFDLIAIDYGYQPVVARSLADPPATPTLALARSSGPQWRVAGIAGALAPDLAERYGVADARVEDLPELERYTRLFTRLGGASAPAYGETFLTQVGPQQAKLLDLLSVRWLFYYDRIPVPAGMREVSAAPRDRLLEHPAAFPRARVVYGAQPAAGLGAALSAVAGASAGQLRDTVVIEGLPAAGAWRTRAAAGAPPASTPATIGRATNTRVEISADAVGAGWLVLSDNYYPGWSATVDGRPAAIRPADAAFRVVAVGPGHHRVVFSYEPATVDVGGTVTLAGIVVALGVILLPRIPRRRAVRALDS